MSKRKAPESGLVYQSSHPLVKHKINQMRKASAGPKYLKQLMHEVSTLLCYEAVADLALTPCPVRTRWRPV